MLLHFLWLVVALPFAGFALLALAGRRLSRRVVAWVGAGSVGLSAGLSLAIAARFLAAPPADDAFRQVLWSWFSVGGLTPAIGLRLDALSLVLLLVVTGVGFLIHLYSTEFMADEEGFSRFFAYMNLFVGSMLVLVLADNLVLLYLGWEGVGLCSYLLIGFWYRDPANGAAARKAFIVTRIGDAALALGLFLLWQRLGTLDIQEVLSRAAEHWQIGTPVAIAAAALLLGGAVGKSAQLPLQTWLPDAMAGPTPVSALIHAATMVTAGVYLVARTHTLFTLAPPVLHAVAVVGAATLLLAAASALVQRDIKRVLAYSTISQIGYMFLALGVGAWSAAIFHLMTHAFFKALLFLGAGAIILVLHHEHDITKMGGLRTRMPVTFWTFLVAGASLAGFPLVTAGFFSKDEILWRAYSSPTGGVGLWAAGLLGAFLTALYIFRVIFLAFFGTASQEPTRRPGRRITLPLVVLGVLSVVGGWIELPRTLGGFSALSDLLEKTLPAAPAARATALGEGALEAIAAAVALLGIGLAWVWVARRAEEKGAEQAAAWPWLPGPLARFFRAGWDFDLLYGTLLVRPFVALCRLNRDDVVDLLYRSLAALARGGHRALSATQTGRLRWYATGIALGAILLVAVAMELLR